MKKILIGILIFLLLVLAYVSIFKGISIGNINVLSVNQIKDENDKLDKKISQTETLIYSEYPSKTSDLEKSVSDLLTAEGEYLDLANVSTEAELKEANKQETYKIEYLWARIGSHATGEGVTLKLDITSGETADGDIKNLMFTVNGNYIAVINFIRTIEDDSELGFRIENFKMVPGSSETGRTATFVVKNVRIMQENITASETNENATDVTSADDNQNANNTETDNDTQQNAEDNTNTEQ